MSPSKVTNNLPFPNGGYPFRTGVFVNGDFAWLTRDSYKNADYLDHTAIGEMNFDFGGLSTVSCSPILY